uniref:Trichome birefringence-like C-terminal domain-containing protein n=1 Tax=Oryza brachyantha TaxID=4533 RepID=J3N6M0_ORYBR
MVCVQAETSTKVLASDVDGDGVRDWRFPAHGFTLMAITTRFLARGEAVLGADGKPTASFDVHLDEPDPSGLPAGARLCHLLRRQLVLLRQLLLQGRSPRRVQQQLQRRSMPASQTSASRSSSAASSMRRSRLPPGAMTTSATYTPSHFQHGSWFDDGYCNKIDTAIGS